MTPATGSVTSPRREAHGTPPVDRASSVVPATLIVLSAIPVIAGSLRGLEIAGGPRILPVNPRIDAVPAPVVVYVVASAVATGLSVSSGWVVNAAVAEWAIRRPSRRRRARRGPSRALVQGSR